MDNSEKQRELLAAYLCLKDSSADDLLTVSELKHVMHYAGFNPTTDFLESVWVENAYSGISFTHFCEICKDFKTMDENDIKKYISDVFIINGDSVSVNDLKSLPNMLKRESNISEFDIDALISELGGKNGVININSMCKLIGETVKHMKILSMKNLEEKLLDQRTKRRTFTKKDSESTLKVSDNMDTKDWFSASLKGSLFIDEDVIIVHHYCLELSCMGPTVIKIMPLKFSSTVLSFDILGFIFRESSDGNKSYVGYTNMKNSDGSNYWVDTLKEGKYLIIPYTTGCIKKKAKDESKTLEILENREKIKLTEECIRLLEDVFYQMDLDGNNLLNRQEFNLYNWRTSGETVQDDEWEVVLKNFEVKDGEVTLSAFLSLHQLEAEDNGGDVEDIWLSLETVGYNRFGHQDKCSPFSVSIYSQVCKPVLLVSGLKSGGLLLDKAVIRSVMEESKSVPICNRNDLIKYELVKEDRASLVIQNKSNENLVVRVDCTESVNCFSNRESLVWEGEIEKRSAIIAHQLAPINIQKPWSVISSEELL
ncbi:UNVERIFIED_CONTAM: hypothetical protein RMT77_010041 [Armadillidium vulgare]